VESFIYDSEGNLTERYQQGHDRFRNVAFSLGYTDLNANAIKYKVSYDYEYDQKGSWIKKTTKHYPKYKPSTDTETCREITYYDDPEEKESSSIKK